MEEQSIQLQKENVKKKIQTMIYKTPENKRLSNNNKNGVNSGFLKRKAVPASLVAPTVLSIRLDYKNATQRVSPVQKQI